MRGERTPAVVAGLVALAAAAALLSPEIGSLGGDDAEYVLLAKSLAAGDGYRSAWGLGEAPLHTLYPPVLPLLLVPLVGGAPGSFLLAHLPVVFAAGVAVFLLARLFARRGLPPWAAAAGALVPALSLLWLRCTVDILSEVPFLAFAAGALLLLDPGGEGPLPPRRLAGAALCAALAFYTRTAGLALVLPVLLVLAAAPRARGRAAWIAAGALAAAVGGWFVYGAIVRGPGAGYGTQLATGGAGPGGSLLASAWGRLIGLYLPGTPSYAFPLPGTVWNVAGVLLWLAAVVGLVRGFRRRGTLEAPGAFLLVALAMQSAWPFEDPRFALPLAPLLVLFALEGVHFLAERSAPAGARPWIAPALAGLLLLPNLHAYAFILLPRANRAAPSLPGPLPPSLPRHDVARFTESWYWNDAAWERKAAGLEMFLSACDLVRAGAPDLPPGPVLLSNPRPGSLFTGRRVLQPPAGASPDEVAALIRDRGIRVVVVDGFLHAYADTLRRYRDARPADLEPLLVLPGDVAIYRVR